MLKEKEESTVTPTGTQVFFIKESPEKLKAFLSERSVDFQILPLSSKLPSIVQFGIIRDPKLQVTRSIPVDIRRESDGYVASWEQAEEFGYGANRSEALEDFGRTIGQLFITLIREKETLSPALLETLNLLQEHLQFRA